MRPGAGERRTNFKKPQDADEARRKREDEALRIRREQRTGALQKKRNVGGLLPWAGGAENQEALVDRTGAGGSRVRGPQLRGARGGARAAAATAGRPPKAPP